MNICCYYS